MSVNPITLNVFIGILTLSGSYFISRHMLNKSRQQLTDEDDERLREVLLRIRYFQLIPFILIGLYLGGKILLPSQKSLANVLFLWTSYNIFLWLKMRWIMRAFRRACLPVNFQTVYIFSQIIGYTGLVSSMLILSQGKIL